MNATYSRIMPSSSMNPMVNSHMPNTLSNVISLTMNTSMSEPTSSLYSPQVWLTYCWATNHMITYMRNLSLATPYPMNDILQTANDEGLQVSHIGNFVLRTSIHLFELNLVLYVPRLSHNLLSMHNYVWTLIIG